MTVLNVNIDHVATIRQARRTDEPDPVWAAVQCELAGANGITVHLRQDRRHIGDRDVRTLKATVACKLNLEMCMAEPIVKIAEEIKPDQVTLVPEKRAELTTEGGLDCVSHKKRLAEVVKRMHKKRILVSTFIAPDSEQIIASAHTGCDAIELHTGMYANAKGPGAIKKRLTDLMRGRDLAMENKLVVHAGARSDLPEYLKRGAHRGALRIQYRPQHSRPSRLCRDGPGNGRNDQTHSKEVS